MKKVRIPHNFIARPYQLELLQALDSGFKRAFCIWHRRSGKDKTLINLIAKKAIERVGIYYYFFPTYTQGRKILWDGIDTQGFAILNHFPEDILRSKNDQQMKLILRNGSVVQIVGTDQENTIRGTNPLGCVFSEYAFQNPLVWDIVRPILAENGGWAVFNTTPNGRNHAFRLYQMAQKSPQWFTQKLSITDTQAFDLNSIEQERAEGVDEDVIQREYFCSFATGAAGAYYAKALQKSQVQKIDYNPEFKVDTWWDLGVSDSTAIIFTQNIAQEIRIIDYLEASGEGLPYYAEKLKEKNYDYGVHHAPHDIRVRELGSGKSRIEIARKLGINFQIVKNIPLIDGINAARAILPNCYFDQEKCARLLDALGNYRKDYDERLKEYRSTPLHDWSSHAADAFRYLAVGFRAKEEINREILRENLMYRQRNFDMRDLY